MVERERLAPAGATDEAKFLGEACRHGTGGGAMGRLERAAGARPLAALAPHRGVSCALGRAQPAQARRTWRIERAGTMYRRR
jgi:hypothetical protein